MNKIFVLVLSIFCFYYADASSQGDASVQNSKIRTLCKKAQDLEEKIEHTEIEIDNLELQEKNSAPLLKSTYDIIARCFTLLFDLQRFSNVLVIKQGENKNDFVRCSIIIKNFYSYFNMVSERLAKNTKEIVAIKQKISEKKKTIQNQNNAYTTLIENIENELGNIPKKAEENIIKNVVYHIATKSNSIDELDAELESENAVGVLKNTKINTNLSLTYPVNGKIVTEFGDKGQDGEMVYCIAFKTRKGAVITSPAKGLVVFSGKFLNYGNMIIISNGEYRIFLYGMSDNMYTTTGDVVEVGDYIGRMDSESTPDKCPVIRMELRKSGESLDPRHWLFETLESEQKKSKISI